MKSFCQNERNKKKKEKNGQNAFNGLDLVKQLIEVVQGHGGGEPYGPE